MVTDTVTSHVSDTKRLYEDFKKENWWVRSWLFPPLFFGLCSVCFASYILSVEVETKMQAYALLGYTVAAIFIPLLALAGIKYFAHDRPWKKYQEKWNIENTWDENVGDMYKVKY